MKLSTHKLENTALVSKTKRLIAQAKTVIKEKSGLRAEGVEQDTLLNKQQCLLKRVEVEGPFNAETTKERIASKE